MSAALPFQNDTTVEKLPGHIVRVQDKLKRVKGIFTEHFAFLKNITARTPKISIPSPSMLHFWGGRSAIDALVYPDLDEFWDDAVAAWTAEITALHALGCRYLQIDDVTFPLICDPHGQEALTARGDDPKKILETYAGVLNRIAAGAPKDLTLGMHMCRGNNRGKWMGSGGYEYVSEVVFRNIDIPNYFMEYDSDRAGDFQPLRHVPKGKHVILGLISTKTPVLESKDDPQTPHRRGVEVPAARSALPEPAVRVRQQLHGQPADGRRREAEARARRGNGARSLGLTVPAGPEPRRATCGQEGQQAE